MANSVQVLDDYKFYIYEKSITDPTTGSHPTGSVILLQIDADSSYNPGSVENVQIEKRTIAPGSRTISFFRTIEQPDRTVTIDVPALNESAAGTEDTHMAFYRGLISGEGNGVIDHNDCKFMVVRYSPISSTTVDTTEVAAACRVSATFEQSASDAGRYNLSIYCRQGLLTD